MWIMVHEALGEDRRFHLRHGYHADVIRPKMFEQFSEGWRDRCVALPCLIAQTSVAWNHTILLRQSVRSVAPKISIS